MAQTTYMWPVKAELRKKSQVNNMSQVQASTSKRYTKPNVKIDIMDVYSFTVCTHDHPMELVNT